MRGLVAYVNKCLGVTVSTKLAFEKTSNIEYLSILLALVCNECRKCCAFKTRRY